MYRYSPLVESTHKGPVRAGDAVRTVAGVDLWSALAHRDPSGSGHALMLVADGAGTFPDYAVPAGVETIRVAPTGGAGALADPDGLVAARYGLGEHGGAILARPDGYVAAVADPSHLTELDDYFAAISVES